MHRSLVCSEAVCFEILLLVQQTAGGHISQVRYVHIQRHQNLKSHTYFHDHYHHHHQQQQQQQQQQEQQQKQQSINVLSVMPWEYGGTEMNRQNAGTFKCL